MIQFSVRFRSAGDARAASRGGVDGIAYLIATDQDGQEWVGSWLGVSSPIDLRTMEVYAASYQAYGFDRVPEGFKPVVKN